MVLPHHTALAPPSPWLKLFPRSASVSRRAPWTRLCSAGHPRAPPASAHLAASPGGRSSLPPRPRSSGRSRGSRARPCRWRRRRAGRRPAGPRTRAGRACAPGRPRTAGPARRSPEAAGRGCTGPPAGGAGRSAGCTPSWTPPPPATGAPAAWGRPSGCRPRPRRSGAAGPRTWLGEEGHRVTPSHEDPHRHLSDAEGLLYPRGDPGPGPGEGPQSAGREPGGGRPWHCLGSAARSERRAGRRALGVHRCDVGAAQPALPRVCHMGARHGLTFRLGKPWSAF